MAGMGPAHVKCPHCGAPLQLPIRVVPAPDTDDRTANFTVTVSTEAVERHLAWCPAAPAPTSMVRACSCGPKAWHNGCTCGCDTDDTACRAAGCCGILLADGSTLHPAARLV